MGWGDYFRVDRAKVDLHSYGRGGELGIVKSRKGVPREKRLGTTAISNPQAKCGPPKLYQWHVGSIQKGAIISAILLKTL